MVVGEITADDITASAAICRLQGEAVARAGYLRSFVRRLMGDALDEPGGGAVVGPAQQRNN